MTATSSALWCPWKHPDPPQPRRPHQSGAIALSAATDWYLVSSHVFQEEIEEPNFGDDSTESNFGGHATELAIARNIAARHVATVVRRGYRFIWTWRTTP